MNPASAWAIANLAVGFGSQSFASSRQCTPLKRASKRLHRVTQWMSVVTATDGSSVSSSKLSVNGRATSPVIESVQAAMSVRGTSPAWRTGHLSVKYWPGGRRDGS